MKLIDLQYTPSYIADQINMQYNELPKGKQSDLLNFFKDAPNVITTT
jgi:hypothetical protein